MVGTVVQMLPLFSSFIGLNGLSHQYNNYIRNKSLMLIHNKTRRHIVFLNSKCHPDSLFVFIEWFCGCYTYFMIYYFFLPELQPFGPSPNTAPPPDTKAATSLASPGSGVLINKSRQRRLKAQKCSRLSDPGSAPLLFLRTLPAARSSF